MRNVFGLGRLVIAALVVALLVGSVFFGSPASNAFAEGGATGPYPSDTTITADPSPSSPMPEPESLINVGVFVLLIRGII